MATPSQAAELKQQGALEAARDPNNPVSSEAAQKTIVDEAKKSGAAAFQFDPNATPQEKAAQAAAAVPPGLKPERKNKATTLVTDFGTGKSDADLPPPSKAGALSPTTAKQVEKSRPANGTIHPEDEGWERVGWEPRFGFPGDYDSAETLQDRQTWLETRLEDRFYGDWYHNAGVIIFACISCWTIAVLGGGLGYVFIVMAICATYYRTSIRRVRRNYRDDINRELAKTRLESDTESLEWINSFLVKFWPIYAPVLCKTIIQSVDQVLSTSTPAFLDSLRMKTFTLGTKPPRLEHVKTYPKSDDDTVLMDWKFSFNPNDTSDMTARQIKVKQNPKVVLEIRVGKGMVSKGLDVIVEDMACSGLMRVKIKLQLPFPHIERVDLSFLEKPTFDYVCKPIGGELFGLDTNFIPGLSNFIQEQIHANLGPMMYDPNVFPIEIAKMLAGTPVDQAIGVVQITFYGGQGLQLPGGGTPDPYVMVMINGRQELYRTKYIKQNANPRWNETTNIIITSLKDSLDLLVYDWNEYRKDREIARTTFPLERFEHQDEYENQQLEVTLNGKPRGNIQCDLRFFPVLGETKLDDGTVLPPPESMTGIARFVVEQAKDLDGTKSLIGQLNPYAALYLNGQEVQVSQKLKRTNNPIWTDASKELLITNRQTAKLGLIIKDDRELAADPVVGSYNIKLDDMLELTKKGQEWYNLMGVKTGRVKMRLEWKPVAMKGAILGAGGYITPIGVIRLHFINARDLKNLETVGKSDPYVRVLLSGIMKGRTVTWRNDLNPDWDEVVYVPVHSSRERITCEVMDEETGVNRDRSLGHFEISLNQYVHQNEETGEYEESNDKKVLEQQLIMGRNRTPKGIVHYTCSFFPVIPVVDPEEEEREKEEAKQAEPNGDVKGKPSMDSTRPSADLARKSAEGTPNKTPGTPIKTGADTRIRNSTSGTISSLKTANSTANSVAEGDASRAESVKEIKEPPKIRLDKDNLMEYGKGYPLLQRRGWDPEHGKSGLLVFKLIDGTFNKQNCHLEMHIDDNAFPAYSTKIRSSQHKFDETSDAMIRELDQSKLSLRLVEHTEKEGKSESDHSIARLSGPTLSTLQSSLVSEPFSWSNGSIEPVEPRVLASSFKILISWRLGPDLWQYTPHTIVLRDKEGHEVAKVNVLLKYLPVKMKLDPSERADNSGKLKVDIMDAADLPAADRNGFSDPYCKFILNGKEVYKTDKQRKTLHPAWNETFDTMIRSRTAAKFVCEVWDWDFGDKSDFLGKADINLEMLEPFTQKEYSFALDGKSGAVRLRMLFTPEYVTKQRQGSSTFQGTFATPGKVVGAPVKGLGKGAVLVAGGVGGGVAKAGSFLGGAFRRRKSGTKDSLEVDANDSTPDLPNGTETTAGATDSTTAARAATPTVALDANHADSATPSPAPPGQITPHNRTKSWGATSQARPESMYGISPSGNHNDVGTATITLLGASGFPPSAHVRIILSYQTSKGLREAHKTKAVKPAGNNSVDFHDGAEQARVPCAADTAFRLKVEDHRTFGADQELGEGQFFVSDQGGGGEQSVKVGSGSVRVRSRFEAAEQGSGLGATPSRGSGTLKSRFGRRSGVEGRERSVTPSGPPPNT